MMDAMSHHPGFWDDELEQLSSDAVAVLGEDVVSATIQHALLQTRDEKRAPLTFTDLKNAMKVELLRLVRPN
jgi:hypothetical protein